MQFNALPFPGHEREQAALAEVVTDLGKGLPAVVTIAGRPGFGQCALLGWAARLAADRGLRVLRAEATLGESGLRYGAVDQLLAPLDESGHGIRRALAGPGPDGRLPGLAELLRTARDRPTLVTVADVGRLDPASLRWCGALIRRLPGIPLAVLASSTGGPHPGWSHITSALGPVPVTQLTLSALTDRDIATVVALICGEPGEETFIAAAAEATAGDSAVVHEALRRFAERGHRPLAARVPELRALIASVTGEHTTRVLSGLPESAVAVLRALAVCGELLDLPLLYTLAGPRAAREPGLRATLEATGLTVASGTGLRLRNADVRARVLEEMSAAERADLFTRAAELAHRAAVPDEDITRLLLSARPAGEPWAVHTLRRTCAAALRAGRSAEAIACLTRALEEPMEPGSRARLGLELAAIEVLTAPEAANRRLEEIIRTEGDHFARARTRAADLGLTRGGAEGLRRAVLSALPAARDAERDELTALFWLSEEVREDDTGLTLADVPPMPDRPPCPAQAGARAWQLGRRAENLPLTRELARHALTGQEGDGALILPRLAAARALFLTDDVEEAETRLDVLHTELRRRHARAASALALAIRGELHLRRGLLDMAERDVAAAERALPHARWHPDTVPYLSAVQIVVSLESGRSDRARALAATAPPTGERQGTAWAYLLFAQGMVDLSDGRVSDARERFLSAGRRLLRRGHLNPALMPWRSMAAQACHAAGDYEEAGRLTREELALARRWGAPSALGWAQLGAGRVAREQRADRLRDAVRTLRGTPALLAFAGALTELARAELDAGDRCAASALVTELATLTTIHRPSSRLAERVRTLTGKVGRPAASGAVPHPAWATLTEAERRTATLAGHGRGNREIAELLSVTIRTVELRLTGAYRKLRIRGRAELRTLIRATEGYGTDVA
ncbi:LuxR C-terminal-related transcriptional regulator [Streptomyces coffeae]|uniref:Helix-turn-helix domain-containing protein n=1 Tax=Streptomyces coffeae TaxID=621382 RepID=A0ABS1N6P3_9ACTN|nr:LuxR C-terminal-related transcriptional regulator [Streptomyces coffeae]MBL1095609.1 helix-turn-helix domain-containing protein [Streptomyces coffeae]